MREKLFNNGYVMIYKPEHPRSRNGNFSGYVYEHIVVAETILGRSLYEGEEVHHLDEQRHNNHPSNLLVLYKGQHTKLHNWLRQNYVVRKPSFLQPKIMNSCPICGNEKSSDLKYCSSNCACYGQRTVDRPDMDTLGKDMVEMPLVQVGKKYGVSDNTIRKWAKAFGLPVKADELR